ncbi:MAG: hypothetical protein ACRD4O_19480 [Bryobacteraceae bacterium]
MAKRCWRTTLVLLACALLVGLASGAGRTNRLDRGTWKRYRNRQFGYCVSYPSRWVKGEASYGAGIWVEAGRKKQLSPLGEMDVGALANTGADVKTAPASLLGDLTAHLQGMKRFERARRMRIVERRAIDILGSSALLLKDRYDDPLDGTAWVDEAIFTGRKEAVYRLELECRADQIARFEPVFERFSGSFRFECGKRR